MPDYEKYRKIFQEKKAPFAFVNLDDLDANTDAIAARTAPDKYIRIASKSVRCFSVLDRIQKRNPNRFIGYMTYHPDETVYLAEKGLDNFLMGYPVVHPDHIRSLCGLVQQGKKVMCMIDLPEHARRIHEIAREMGVVMPVCMDVDMSSQFPMIYFGVLRSSVKTLKDAVNLAKVVQSYNHIELRSLMGYEAQIAGLGDAAPGKAAMNAVIKFLKSRSIKELAERRGLIVNELQKMGFTLEWINGGGTGSIESTNQEPYITEITVGSGFYQSTLFDNYSNFRHRPAAGYAVEITRNPKPNVFTCYGGGYTASGTPGPEKGPTIWLPEGAKLFPNEGAGEVQTPFEYNGGVKLQIGDPIFLRHAKAGELCERFNSLLFVSGDKIVDEVPTYRGDGKCFL